MSIVDRPITQQGLSGLRSAATGRGSGPAPRQVQDRRYFQGLLQMKCREIAGATQRLHQEMEALRLEQSTYLTYDARAKQMAQELTGGPLPREITKGDRETYPTRVGIVQQLWQCAVIKWRSVFALLKVRDRGMFSEATSLLVTVKFSHEASGDLTHQQF